MSFGHRKLAKRKKAKKVKVADNVLNLSSNEMRFQPRHDDPRAVKLKLISTFVAIFTSWIPSRALRFTRTMQNFVKSTFEMQREENCSAMRMNKVKRD